MSIFNKNEQEVGPIVLGCSRSVCARTVSWLCSISSLLVMGCDLSTLRWINPHPVPLFQHQ